MNITDSLGLDPKFRDTGVDMRLCEKVDTAIEKYKCHSSIIAIKGGFNTEQKLEFSHINPADVMAQIEALDVRKSCSGNIPTSFKRGHLSVSD